MTKIALIGYGKMGKIIEKLALEKGHVISAIIDPNNDNTEKEINESTLKDAEVCIDFSHPDVVMGNIKKLANLKKNIVVGTTGWYDKTDEVKKIVKENNIGLIWSGNFSIGVNMYFRMIRQAAKIVNSIDNYDIAITNIHHNQKADSPSGTALMMSDILIEEINRKKSIVTEDLKRKIKPDEINVSSTVVGSVPGTHSVYFDSEVDTIELKHTARNREGFAHGSIIAAEFIKDKKGFFNINDLMDNIIKGDKDA